MKAAVYQSTPQFRVEEILASEPGLGQVLLEGIQQAFEALAKPSTQLQMVVRME